jgi:hypothetical protein
MTWKALAERAGVLIFETSDDKTTPNTRTRHQHDHAKTLIVPSLLFLRLPCATTEAINSDTNKNESQRAATLHSNMLRRGLGKIQDAVNLAVFGKEMPTNVDAFFKIVDRDMKGDEVPMSNFKGSVLCVVNVASN